MTVPGVDTAGDGGLLGLALSPTYLEDGLLYAYLSTATDNRVVRFPLGGTPNPVLTGIPRGATDNGGALLFGAGRHACSSAPATPATRRWPPIPNSLAGKVLRIDTFGRAVGASPVYSRGHRDVTALCQAAAPTARRPCTPPTRRRRARTSSTRSPRAATTAARADAAGGRGPRRGGRSRRLRRRRPAGCSSAPWTASGCTR